jgi:hypothetical protein
VACYEILYGISKRLLGETDENHEILTVACLEPELENGIFRI